MKITKNHLENIIREELQGVLDESSFDRMRDRRHMRGTWKSSKRPLRLIQPSTEEKLKKHFKDYLAANKEKPISAQGFLDYLAIDPETQKLAQAGYDDNYGNLYFSRRGIYLPKDY